MKWNKGIRVLLLTVLSCQLFLFGCGNKEEVIMLEEVSQMEITTEAAAQEDYEETMTNVIENRICVFVCGAVENSGVYELPEGSRVYEALQMAGGCMDEAATEAINQARILNDGEQLRIPTKAELAEGAVLEAPVDNASTGNESVNAGDKINLNTASEESLTTLKGIGTSKAQAIITYREEHGGFRNTEEIMNISGIGEHTYEKIKEQISVR